MMSVPKSSIPFVRTGFIILGLFLGLVMNYPQDVDAGAPPPVPAIVTEDLERATAFTFELTELVGAGWPWQVWEDSFACFSNEGPVSGYQASARRKFKTPKGIPFDYERALDAVRSWFADNGFEIIQERPPDTLAKAHELRAVNKSEAVGIIASGRPDLFSVRVTCSCRDVE